MHETECPLELVELAEVLPPVRRGSEAIEVGARGRGRRGQAHRFRDALQVRANALGATTLRRYELTDLAGIREIRAWAVGPGGDDHSQVSARSSSRFRALPRSSSRTPEASSSSERCPTMASCVVACGPPNASTWISWRH